MSRYIIKPIRDRDFYVEWSSNVDGPLLWGSRAVLEHTDPDRFSSDRFERADETGTSSFIGEDGFEGSVDYVIVGGGTFVQRDLIESWINAFDEEGNDTPESNAFLEEFN